MLPKARPLYLCALLCGCSAVAPRAVGPTLPPVDARALSSFCASFVETHLSFSPTYATLLDFHRFDGELERYDRESLRRQVAFFRSARQKVRAFKAAALSLDARIDLELVDALSEQSLYALEEQRDHERNPLTYSGPALDSVSYLLERSPSSLPRRAEAVRDRLRKIPSLLDDAERNLRDCPTPWTEAAIRQLSSARDLYVGKVKATCTGLEDDKLEEKLAAAGLTAAEAAERFVAFLKEKILPRARADFALGPAAVALYLRTQEFITVPVDALLETATRMAADTRAELTAVGQTIAPGTPTEKLVHDLMQEHPTAAELLATVTAAGRQMEAFVRRGALLTFPAEISLDVRETPPHLRDRATLTAMTPGPFSETGGAGTMFVSPPRSDWPRATQDEYLTFFNRSLLPLVVAHEGVPGHVLQLFQARRATSPVRRVFFSLSFIEGWAHYCEAMVLDQGFSADPRLRFFSLYAILGRLERMILVIKMHTRGMTVEQAAETYQREAFVSPVTARREASVFSYELGKMSYALGRWQILQLLHDYRARRGSSFSLRAFHDELLAHGSLPIPVLRRLILR